MSKNILIIEDEPLVIKSLQKLLKKHGYTPLPASSGEEALLLLKKNDVDLIISDIRMPKMDGLEALNKILSKCKNIPIIIYTAYNNYQSNFITWNVDAFITKSSDMGELKDKIKELLTQDKKVNHRRKIRDNEKSLAMTC